MCGNNVCQLYSMSSLPSNDVYVCYEQSWWLKTCFGIVMCQVQISLTTISPRLVAPKAPTM